MHIAEGTTGFRKAVFLTVLQIIISILLLLHRTNATEKKPHRGVPPKDKYIEIRIPHWTSVPRYEWIPPYDGECLFNDRCIHVSDTALVLQDYRKSPNERTKTLSRLTCRKSSNLECVDNICKCMAFGPKNETGIWDFSRLKCNAIVGSSCAMRPILYPGEIVRTLLKPECIMNAECSENLLDTDATCECKENFKPVNNNTACARMHVSTASRALSFRLTNMILFTTPITKNTVNFLGLLFIDYFALLSRSFCNK